MRKIFIDLEMHPLDREYREESKICKYETIEIGAVVLGENGEVTDRFKEYVKPAYSKAVRKKYEDLTGITTATLAGAEKFEEVYGRFVAWCGEKDYEIYSWSKNDLNQIKKEMDLKSIQPTEEITYMIEHWLDFQNEFQKMLNLEMSPSLDKALTAIGIQFQGRAHDGLTDAENTAKLYHEVHDSESVHETMEAIRRIMTPQTGTTLGELFNLEGITLS
ncbi:Inhibitor of the KinA pathway to sporulation, predicted exonuclease [Lachnospiraceae bacterium]|nr:Inhibitor of the KinA pathway to sporulation, predicted exonuclease [Lachnospiraceae bacterium]